MGSFNHRLLTLIFLTAVVNSGPHAKAQGFLSDLLNDAADALGDANIDIGDVVDDAVDFGKDLIDNVPDDVKETIDSITGAATGDGDRVNLDDALAGFVDWLASGGNISFSIEEILSELPPEVQDFSSKVVAVVTSQNEIEFSEAILDIANLVLSAPESFLDQVNVFLNDSNVQNVLQKYGVEDTVEEMQQLSEVLIQANRILAENEQLQNLIGADNLAALVGNVLDRLSINPEKAMSQIAKFLNETGDIEEAALSGTLLPNLMTLFGELGIEIQNPLENDEFLSRVFAAAINAVMNKLGIEVGDEEIDNIAGLVIESFRILQQFGNNGTTPEVILSQVVQTIATAIVTDGVGQELRCSVTDILLENILEETINSTMLRELAGRSILFLIGCGQNSTFEYYVTQIFKELNLEERFGRLSSNFTGQRIQRLLNLLPSSPLRDFVSRVLTGDRFNHSRIPSSLFDRVNKLGNFNVDINPVDDIQNSLFEFRTKQKEAFNSTRMANLQGKIRGWLDNIRGLVRGGDVSATTTTASSFDMLFRTSGIIAETTSNSKDEEFPSSSAGFNLFGNTLARIQDLLRTQINESRQRTQNIFNRTTSRLQEEATDLVTEFSQAMLQAATSYIRGYIRNATAPLRQEARESIDRLLDYPILSEIVLQSVQTLTNPAVLETALRKIPNLNETDIARVMAVAEFITSSQLFQNLLAMLENADPSKAAPTVDDFANAFFSSDTNAVRDEPMVQALTAAAPLSLDMSDVAEPTSAVMILVQTLATEALEAVMSRAQELIQTTVLEDPVAFVDNLIKTTMANDSILSGFIPAETLQSIVQGISPLLQVGGAAYSVSQVFSSSYNTSQRCATERAAIATGLGEVQSWALVFVDSMGKLTTGVLQGNTYLMGNYDQCMSISGQTASGDVIKGVYVKYQFLVVIPGFPTVYGAMPYQMSGLPVINWQLCLPSGCNDDDVQTLGAELAQNLGVQLMSSKVVKYRDPGDDPVFIVAVIVFGVLGLLCLMGTAVDLTLQKKPTDSKSDNHVTRAMKSNNKNRPSLRPQEEIYQVSPTGERVIKEPNFRDLRMELAATALHGGDSTTRNTLRNGGAPMPILEPELDHGLTTRFLLAFSLNKNVPDILKAKHSPGDIACLHGIRVMSISWVILGHTLFFAPQIGNLLSLLDMTKTWPFQAIVNATYSVDTFFLLSGVLVAYLFLRSTEKAGGLKAVHMVHYYVHRYLRLTPLYGLCILLYVGITPYLESGPFQGRLEDREGDCGELWWWNLLYISNLRTDMKMCIGWAWYLPNDMQFYVVAPMVLIPLALGYKVIGLLAAFAQFACHVIVQSAMQEKYNSNTWRNTTDNFIYIYIKPYCRVAPYAIGLALGYLLFKTKCKVKIHFFFQVIGWLLATGVGLVLVYLRYDDLKDFGFVDPAWSNDLNNAFEIVKRPLWALVVSWVVFACATGHGGVVNSILSWQAWIPLSRLTFGTYLTHVMVMHYFNNNKRDVSYFTADYMLERYLAVVILSYGLSFILSLLIETPVRNLIKPSRKPALKATSEGKRQRSKKNGPHRHFNIESTLQNDYSTNPQQRRTEQDLSFSNNDTATNLATNPNTAVNLESGAAALGSRLYPNVPDSAHSGDSHIYMGGSVMSASTSTDTGKKVTFNPNPALITAGIGMPQNGDGVVGGVSNPGFEESEFVSPSAPPESLDSTPRNSVAASDDAIPLSI